MLYYMMYNPVCQFIVVIFTGLTWKKYFCKILMLFITWIQHLKYMYRKFAIRSMWLCQSNTEPAQRVPSFTNGEIILETYYVWHIQRVKWLFKKLKWIWIILFPCAPILIRIWITFSDVHDLLDTALNAKKNTQSI